MFLVIGHYCNVLCFFCTYLRNGSFAAGQNQGLYGG